MAPRHYGPLTKMRTQRVTAELKLSCALLVEVGYAALQDILQDRMMIGENKTRTANHKQNGKKAEAAQ